MIWDKKNAKCCQFILLIEIKLKACHLKKNSFFIFPSLSPSL